MESSGSHLMGKKCARTLSDLENMCWVCESPFDESKPVIPYKKEEEKVEVEEKIRKEKIQDYK